MAKIGIIGAMELEVSALKRQLEGITVRKKAGMEFCEGTIGGKNVVVVRSGIGKVNAALCVQILCDDFGFKYWGIMCNKDALSYRQTTPFSTVSYIGGPFQVFLKGNPLRYDEALPLKEDYDMTLQNCNKYRGCLRVNKYHYDCQQSKQKGGCATYRNYEREIQQLEALQKKWGSDIVKIDNVLNHNAKKEKRSIEYNPIIHIPIAGV